MIPEIQLVLALRHYQFVQVDLLHHVLLEVQKIQNVREDLEVPEVQLVLAVLENLDLLIDENILNVMIILYIYSYEPVSYTHLTLPTNREV